MFGNALFIYVCIKILSESRFAKWSTQHFFKDGSLFAIDTMKEKRHRLSGNTF